MERTMDKIVSDIIQYAEANNMTICDVVREAEIKAVIKICLTSCHNVPRGKLFMISTPHTPSNRNVFMNMYDDVEDDYIIPVTKSSAIGMTEHEYGPVMDDIMVCEDDTIDVTSARMYTGGMGDHVCELKMRVADEHEFLERVARGRENSYYIQNTVPKYISKQSQRFNKKPTNNPIAGRSY